LAVPNKSYSIIEGGVDIRVIDVTTQGYITT